MNKTVAHRTEITVAHQHKSGGLYRWFYSYAMTFEDGTQKIFTGDDCTEALSMKKALRESGRMIERGYDWEEGEWAGECPSCGETVGRVFVVEAAVCDQNNVCPVMCAECVRRFEIHVACGYCDSIESMTGNRNCPIHSLVPPISGEADVERTTRLEAERVTLEFRQRSTRRIDAGREPISDSPLFGGPAQQSLF